MLMNSPFVTQQAHGWAEQLLDDAALGDDAARIEHAFEAAFAQPPTTRQLQSCLDFLNRGRAEDSAVERWSDLCHMLINMKAFLFLN